MTPKQLRKLEAELEDFLGYITNKMGRSERREALANYVRGLLLDGERKSMVPLAKRLAQNPERYEATRQQLQQAVTYAGWDESEIFRRLALRVEDELPGIEAFVIDDTGFPKKGEHSVGVHRQYSGALGRIGSCQVATSLHLASEEGGACIGMRLFLPEVWADESKRRTKAGVPEGVAHETKHKIALGLLDQALGWGLTRRPVLADAAYGDAVDFRKGLEERGLHYVLRVSGTAVVWPPGTCPSPPPPKPPGVGGRPRTKWVAPEGVKPISIAELAKSLPAHRFRTVKWREGSSRSRKRRFTWLRVRTAHRHGSGEPPGDEQWLLCEWSDSKKEPKAFYLSNLPEETLLKQLVYLAKLRWRVERDYQEMKGELGLDHFEGRTWRGFHHHVALVAAAHAFLTLHRVLFSPEDPTATKGSARPAQADHPGIPHAAPDRLASHAGPLPHVRARRRPARAPTPALADVIK